MKRINEKYFTIGVYALGVTAASVLFLLFCLNFNTVFSFLGNTISALASIFYGILLAFLLLPLAKRFERGYQALFCKKKARPLLVTVLSVISAYLIALVIVGVTVGFIIPALIRNVKEFAAYISVAWSNFGAWAEARQDAFPFLYEYYQSISAVLAGGTATEGMEIPFLNLSADSVIATVTTLLSSVINQASNIFMGLIISIYLLGARRVISGICGKLVVAFVPKKSVVPFVIFFKRLYTDFCTFAASRVLVVFFFSALVFLFCWLLNIPMFSILVVILLLAHLIPAIGPVVGDVIAITLALLLDPLKGLFFMLFLIGIEVVASKVAFPLMTPKKLRPSFGLTAVIVLIAGHFLGVVGAFCAVPLFATLNIEFREILAHRLAKKGMPIATEVYEKTPLEELSRMSAESARIAEEAAEQSEEKEDGAENEIREAE